MIEPLPDFTFDSIEDFTVVRDDKVPGGTKTRVLFKMLPRIDQTGIVYAAHPYGYGAEALAIACTKFRKQLTLFYTPYTGYPNSAHMPRPMRKATVQPEVTYSVVPHILEQITLEGIAKRYAEKRDLFFFEVGFAQQEFFNTMVQLIKETPSLESYSEIWVAAGSGLMARALAEALPNAGINAVSLGMPHCDTGGINTMIVDEEIEEKAKFPPPFPSASYYDAKIWQLVVKNASKGALFWNVAG